MSKHFVLLSLVLGLAGCGEPEFEAAPQKVSAVAGMAGMSSAGEAGKSGSSGSAGKPSVGGSSGHAGMSNTGGSSAGMPSKGGSGNEPSTGGTGDTGSGATGGSDAGKGGTDAGTGGTGNTGNEGGTGDEPSVGGSSGVGGSMAGMGNTGNDAGMGGTSAGTGSTGGSSGAGSTGGTTGGSAGVGGTAGTGGSTGGTSAVGGTGGSTAGTGGTTAGTGGTGPACTVGAICRAATGECDQPEYFDADCYCPADLQKSNGSACGNQTSSACDDKDTCQAGVCVPNHKSAGMFCGGQDASNCRADECDGNGTCVPNQPAFSGQTCGSASCSNGVETGIGVCDGLHTGCTQTTTECFGPCEGNSCKYPGIIQVTTTNASSIGPIANNTNHIFWSTSNGISKIAKANWTTTTFSTGQVAQAIVATDSAVFFSDSNGVRCMSASGGTIYNVWSGKVPLKLVTDGSNVFWSDHAQDDASNATNKIWSSSATCNGSVSMTVSSIYTGGGWVLPFLAVTADSIYFQERSGNGAAVLVRQIAKCVSGICSDLGTISKYGSLTFNPDRIDNLYLGTSGSNLYFIGSTNAASNYLWSAPLSSPISDGSVAALNTKTYSLAAVPQWTIGANYIYAANERMPLSGGATTMTKWAAHFPMSDVDSDADAVYFSSGGYYTDLAHAQADDGIVTSVKGLYLHPMD